MQALVEASRAQGLVTHVGPVVTSDVFYDPHPDGVARWGRRGYLSAEMETAALYLLAMRERAKGRPVRAGSILTVSDVIVDPTFEQAVTTIGDETWFRPPEEEVTRRVDLTIGAAMPRPRHSVGVAHRSGAPCAERSALAPAAANDGAPAERPPCGRCVSSTGRDVSPVDRAVGTGAHRPARLRAAGLADERQPEREVLDEVADVLAAHAHPHDPAVLGPRVDEREHVAQADADVAQAEMVRERGHALDAAPRLRT